MNQNFRKTALMVGAFSLLGLCYSPKAYAAEAPQDVQQATKKITGTVVDAMGPVIGASVVEKGNAGNGVVTDFDGNFTLSVKPGATIVISYIGYESQEIRVGEQSFFSVTLKEDNAVLEEVVVVGYGVQKKKLVTGATVQVKGDEIAALNTTTVLGALQSNTPGMQIIQSSGQPGESGYKVNIRGAGTIGNSAPLYVIDGFAGGDINSLNPSDIESVDVLKDAASAAIYGARAANGVVLVTTKQGKEGRVQINYDGYVGWQYLAKKPDVLNAQDYMAAYDMMSFYTTGKTRDWQGSLPGYIWEKLQNGWTGTNWIDETYHKGAVKTNHAINLNGGNDRSKFSAGFAYTKQDGIFGHDRQSKFERYNARINSDHVILKAKDFDVITIGENFTWNHSKNSGIATGNLYWNNMHDALIASPLLPPYDQKGRYYDPDSGADEGWTVGTVWNPLVNINRTGQGLKESYNYSLNLNTYLEVQPIKNLKWRSQFSYRQGNGTYRTYTMAYKNGTNMANIETMSSNMSTWSNWAFENTLSYHLVAGKHTADAVIGQSLEKNSYAFDMRAQSANSIFPESWDHAYLENFKPSALNDIIKNKGFGGNPASDSSLASFFGRLSYNYDEKYMLQFTLRADGSSNFIRGKRWGYFPSASVGWVLTNEKFMEGTRSWLDFLKIRASWGQNGNCSISNFQYVTSFKFDESNGYFFGDPNQVVAQTTGAYADVLKNEDVTWETSEQINIGIDARFISGRLGLTFDIYQKKTKDWLVQAPILGVYGMTAPYINGGDVENKGFEVGLTWNDHIGKDFTYGAGVNFAYNKNKVTRIANSEQIIHGPANVLLQGATEIYRAQVGEPIGFFYGLKTDGVFQNQAQIDQWLQTYTDEIHGTPQPGDLIYVDADGNKTINLDDRQNIGDPHPDFTLGFNVHAEYKGFDFSVTGNGSFGQQVVRNSNNGPSSVDNLSKRIYYGSWKGEGTSNFLPRLTSIGDINYSTFSSIWLEDADYVRIQNVTLGYDFSRLWKQDYFSKLRLYVAAENLYTFTGYTGMDPEVGASGNDSYTWGMGIDGGFYPVPRTYMIGMNITFKDKSEKKAAAQPKTVYVTDNAEIDRLNGEINKLRAENEQLRNKPAEVIEKNTVATFPYLVNFVINKTDVVNREKVNLQAVADMIKATPGKKYNVVGYADAQTGNAEGNAQLAQSRAQNVYDILVNQYGVSRDSLVLDSKGGVDNMYYDDAQLSRSVIISEVK